MKEDKEYPQRTKRQNKSLHLYYDFVALALNSSGLDMKKTLDPGMSIAWTPVSVKECLWKPFQKAKFEKESTTELSTVEIQDVFEELSKYLSENFDIVIEWPSYFNNMIDRDDVL